MSRFNGFILLKFRGEHKTHLKSHSRSLKYKTKLGESLAAIQNLVYHSLIFLLPISIWFEPSQLPIYQAAASLVPNRQGTGRSGIIIG